MSFLNFNRNEMLKLLASARKNIIYAAPGIFREAADAIVTFAGKAGVDKVSVVLDPDPEVCRNGYGDIHALQMLTGAGIEIRREPFLRIGTIIVDGKGIVFAPTPLIIESDEIEMMNALTINPEQAGTLTEAILPTSSPEKPKPPAAEIGNNTVSVEELDYAQKDLERRPPRKFDIERLIKVYQSYLQFVELELEGCSLKSHTFQIPKDILPVFSASETRERFNATFKLLDETSKLNERTKKLNDEVKKIRKKYLNTLGKFYGMVILVDKRKNFDQQIEEFKEKLDVEKNSILNELEAEFKNSKSELFKALLPGVMNNPPDILKKGIFNDKVTERHCEGFLEAVLEKSFPKPKDLVSDMKLNCVIKGITYEMLQDPNFLEAVKKAFPYENWDLPFKESDAVKVNEQEMDWMSLRPGQ